jgi:hypothetical protein
MKKILFIFLALQIFAACKKDSPKKINEMLVEGSWKVTLFQEDSENKTDDFLDHTFIFKDNGDLAISSTFTNATGTWSTTYDDDHTDLVINIPSFSNPSYEDISDDWEVILKTENILELEDVSGDGTKDLLTFERK